MTRLMRSFRILGAALFMCGSLAAHAADPDLVARGAYLAKAGDCIACHTALHGQPFAGGFEMMTPMGAIYSTSITPDLKTGIGSYTEAELREGIAKDGHNLYPSYAKLKDDDAKALYAYFMYGVHPVVRPNRASDIPLPLNMR